MTDILDMSLDDLIRKNKQARAQNGNSRAKDSTSASRRPGPDRRPSSRNLNRTKPYHTPQPKQVMAEPIMLQQQMIPTAVVNKETGPTTLYVSNLDYGVSNEDLELLFSEEGELKRYSIHYESNGRSKGTAEVVFCRHLDALSAIKRYNNVNLDGKPMKIELVGTNLVAPIPVPPTQSNIVQNHTGISIRGPVRIGAEELARGGARGIFGAKELARGDARGIFGAKELVRGVAARGNFGAMESVRGGAHGFIGGRGTNGGSRQGNHQLGTHRGGRQGNHIGKKERPTAKDLDAELEKYHLEAMRIK